VYHYTDAKKSRGIAFHDEGAVPEVTGVNQNADAAEVGSVFQPRGLNKYSDGAEGYLGQTKCGDPPAGTNGEAHPRVLCQRKGMFFWGKMKWFDSRSQGSYIVFEDGDAGWFQLWRCTELVTLILRECYKETHQKV
jgi:hypothetical protein